MNASLGSDVEEAVTQEGGYSPGAAVRVRTANGRRAFVKALSEDRHSPSLALYRNEAEVMPHLPEDLPVPRLLDVYDDGSWVALVYEDIEGRHPEIPWSSADMDRVAGAISDLGSALDPSPWTAARRFEVVNAGVMAAWRAFSDSPPGDLDAVVIRMLDRLAAEAVDLAEVVRGEALMHNDIRSDNILLTPGGRVVFTDWGMPCRGSVWQDLMMFAFPAAAEGADPDLLVRTHPLTRDVAKANIDIVVAAGYAAYRMLAERPVDPSVPDGNSYHVACAKASLRWLERRAASP